jgi:hypothetical protein
MPAELFGDTEPERFINLRPVCVFCAALVRVCNVESPVCKINICVMSEKLLC